MIAEEAFIKLMNLQIKVKLAEAVKLKKKRKREERALKRITI